MFIDKTVMSKFNFSDDIKTYQEKCNVSQGSILLQVDASFHDLCHPGTSVITNAA